MEGLGIIGFPGLLLGFFAEGFSDKSGDSLSAGGAKSAASFRFSAISSSLIVPNE